MHFYKYIYRLIVEPRSTLLLITIYLKRYAKKKFLSFLYHLSIYRLLGKQVHGLHLGSGNGYIPGFINIDANQAAPCDIVSGINKLKFASDSVGVIYNSHVLEHIPRVEAQKVLAEWFRVLKPQGKLYICVPDCEVLFKIYLSNLSQYDTPKGRYLVDMACGVTFGGQNNQYDFHYHGYSFTTLKYMLNDVGFKGVQYFDRSKIEFYQVGDAALSTIEDIPISLNLVAIK